jgi:hypothetical protein
VGKHRAVDDFERALKNAVAALRDGPVPFLLGGSLAAWARGGPMSQHDLDLVVKPEDADRALELLQGAGMRPERPPEEWLYKAWDGDILVDVIFEPRGLEVTDEVIDRGEELHILGITIPVMALEDVLATKLMALDEHELDYSSIVLMTRALREKIDWTALAERTRESPYARAFFALAKELEIAPTGHADGAQVRLVNPQPGSAA